MIKKYLEEVNGLNVLCEEQKSSIELLQSDREKLRAQVKAYQKMNKTNSDSVVCRNCRQRYMESENFNWSCKRHFSTFSGQFYWCCGRKGETAPGCLTSEHESNENSKEEVVQAATLAPCPSCKKLGHDSYSCPLDPNARSGFDAVEE